MIHPEVESDELFNPLQMLQVNEDFQGGRVRLRAGRTLPMDLAQIVNPLIARYADRFVVSSNQRDLEALTSEMKNIEHPSPDQP